ncbi:MAG: c-type cytochrome biogenesis protein CcmF, partial [Lysobacterales bacterium]
MIAELGQVALILALLLALVQATLPLLGSFRGREDWMALARPAAFAQSGFVALAFVLLAVAFVMQDFSLAYVAQHSNLRLPPHYRISAVWGAHEGSLLLWVLVLGGWTSALALASRRLPQPFMARVLSVLGIVSVGFIAFTLFTSNPFERLLPAAADGQ